MGSNDKTMVMLQQQQQQQTVAAQQQLQQQQQEQQTLQQAHQSMLLHGDSTNHQQQVITSHAALSQPQVITSLGQPQQQHHQTTQQQLHSLVVSQSPGTVTPHIIVTNTADAVGLQQPHAGLADGLKTLQVGQVFQTVTGPNGEQQLVQIHHDLQHVQTAQQLAHMAQTVQQLQQFSQSNALPLTIVKNSSNLAFNTEQQAQQAATVLPLTQTTAISSSIQDASPPTPISEASVLPTATPATQNVTEGGKENKKKLDLTPILVAPTVKNLLPNTSEVVKELKERFLRMSADDRRDYLNWMVWRLSDAEAELLENKLEKKKRLKSRKGSRRKAGLSGEKVNVCKFCTKSFSKKTHLIVHERVHTGERPYVCHICDKSFAQSTGLKTHLMKHTVGETPYECSICFKKVTTKGNLKLHEKLHSGERPFFCPHCDRTFPRKSALTRHMWIHDEDKPFRCTYCVKCFRRKADLETHERIHTGVKPFVCQFCAKAFSDQRNWKAHEKKHTGALNCPNCGRGPFQKQRELRAHMATHSNETVTNQQQDPQQQLQQQQQQIHPTQQNQVITNCDTVNTSAINVIASIPTSTSKDIEVSQLQHATIIGINCQFCGKLFKEQHHLEVHIATHHMDNSSATQLDTTAQVSQQMQYQPQQQNFNGTLVQVQTFN